MPQLFWLKWKQWDKFHLSNAKSASLPVVVQSVSQLCLTLCDPIDCSTPRFPSFTIAWSLLIVLWVSDASLPEPLLILSSCQFQWKIGPSDQKPDLYWTLHISALGFSKTFLLQLELCLHCIISFFISLGSFSLAYKEPLVLYITKILTLCSPTPVFYPLHSKIC